MILLEPYGDGDRAAWDAFVRASKNGNFLFLRDYMEYHRDRFEDASLLARRRPGGPPLALLPANRRGATLESHGGLTFGGWVCGAEMTATAMLELFAVLGQRLAGDGVSLLRYRAVPHVYHRAPADEDVYALHRLGARVVRRAPLSVVDQRRPLPWQTRRRRGLKRAAASGLVCGESADHAGYWELLTAVLQETYDARPVHTLEEIERLRRAFPANIRLFTCRRGQALLAGVLVFESETVARAQYIAASEEGRREAALDLLFDHLLREVFAGKDWFDLGTSEGAEPGTLNGGVLEYKESLGARLVAQDTYELTIGGDAVAAREEGRWRSPTAG
ncbi:MAG TPA: GNAT family N-acetyltransferase [Thermoanaerobaculia bacterium]|nr:GNAT family N-acetyltransferase [Thermoanaerobaculia bacterium]